MGHAPTDLDPLHRHQLLQLQLLLLTRAVLLQQQYAVVVCHARMERAALNGE